MWTLTKAERAFTEELFRMRQQKEDIMSQNLYWRPWKPSAEGCLPKRLRDIIEARYPSVPVILDKVQYDWLTGLRDADVKGAAEIMDAIDKHGMIELYLE